MLTNAVGKESRLIMVKHAIAFQVATKKRPVEIMNVNAGRGLSEMVKCAVILRKMKRSLVVVCR
jgi:hypothetical protein